MYTTLRYRLTRHTSMGIDVIMSCKYNQTSNHKLLNYQFYKKFTNICTKAIVRNLRLKTWTRLECTFKLFIFQFYKPSVLANVSAIQLISLSPVPMSGAGTSIPGPKITTLTLPDVPHLWLW